MACVCMCVSVYVRECVRTSVQQERETGTWPKIPSLPPCPTPPPEQDAGAVCREQAQGSMGWGRARGQVRRQMVAEGSDSLQGNEVARYQAVLVGGQEPSHD